MATNTSMNMAINTTVHSEKLRKPSWKELRNTHVHYRRKPSSLIYNLTFLIVCPLWNFDKMATNLHNLKLIEATRNIWVNKHKT